MIGYASNTGTRRNLAALREHGWRILLQPTGSLDPHGFRYCLDNGAWTAYQQGTEWDVWRWVCAVANRGSGADFIVLPDIVCGGRKSLQLSLFWLSEMKDEAMLPTLLIPAQNGMERADLEPHVGLRVGIFVGGDDEYKEQSLPMWGALRRDTGCYLHVGRVNSQRRIRLCHMAGADSFDGTSLTRHSVNAPMLTAAVRGTDRKGPVFPLLPPNGEEWHARRAR